MTELTTKTPTRRGEQPLQHHPPLDGRLLIGVEKGAEVIWTLEGDELVGRVAGGEE
jgi:hypothetical protein